MNHMIPSISNLFLLGWATASAFANPTVQYVTPTDFDQTSARLEELRLEYTPYLRSLPEKVNTRSRTSLNGDWRFAFEVKDPPKRDTPPPAPPNWFGVDFDDNDWETTTVPEWRYRTVGHDNLYIRKVDKVRIAGDNRNTSQICWYRRAFTASRAADGRRLWLCFDGVAWEAQVYLNGEWIGSHCVYHEPFRFDVTDNIKTGENTLAVRVINGKVFGEPMWAWTIFPDIRAERQRYTPDGRIPNLWLMRRPQ